MKARAPSVRHLPALLLCVAGLVHAAGKPAAQPPPPLEIEANQVEINDKTGISTYKGDVQVTRGRVHLNCDTLTIHHEKGQVQRAECQGHPATFHRTALGKEKAVRGHSDWVEYYMGDEHVVLRGNAFLEQAGDTFTSQRIVYYVHRDVVHAGSPEKAGGRVHITIHPKEKKDDQGTKDKGAE